MKKLQVGDRVRFLNSVGGGLVKGFQSKHIVIVEDEHNFDVPVLISECVVIEPSDSKKMALAIDNFHEDDRVLDTEPEIRQETTVYTDYTDNVEETIEGERITTCLAFLPTDPKNISKTQYECFFINDSNYYLFFNYMSRKDNTWKSRYTGTIEPNMQILIEEFDKEALNDMEQVCVQFVAFKKGKSYRFKDPVSVDIRIDTVKFYKLHTFTENDYFDDKALTYYITRNDVPERGISISSEDLQQAMQKKVVDRRPRKKTIEKRKKDSLLEIDLHINQLLDSTTGMTNADMLEYQMSKFNEVIEANIKRKGQRIVFIHGKGNGVLKNSILKEIKKKYKKFYVQDASFKEYGYGATMVTIK